MGIYEEDCKLDKHETCVWFVRKECVCDKIERGMSRNSRAMGHVCKSNLTEKLSSLKTSTRQYSSALKFLPGSHPDQAPPNVVRRSRELGRFGSIDMLDILILEDPKRKSRKKSIKNYPKKKKKFLPKHHEKRRKQGCSKGLSSNRDILIY